MGRFRRIALVAGGIVLLAGCESHDVTREPDPPLPGYADQVITVAVVLAAVVWTGLVVRALWGGRPVASAYRWMAGAAYATTAVAISGYVLWSGLSDLRMESILGDGGCRSLPLADRPRQIVQLTCDDLMGGTAFALGLIFGLPAVLVALACAWELLGRRSPWFSTGLAALVLVLVGRWMLVSASPEDDIRSAWVALLVAGVATAGGVLELLRDPGPSPSPDPTPDPSPTGAGVVM